MDKATAIAAAAIGGTCPGDTAVIAAGRAVYALRAAGMLREDQPPPSEHQLNHIGPAWFPHRPRINLGAGYREK